MSEEMSCYDYETEKHRLMTKEGYDLAIIIGERAAQLLDDAGAFTIAKVLDGVSGDSFLMLACVGYLESIGVIKNVYSGGCTQTHVYVVASKQ